MARAKRYLSVAAGIAVMYGVWKADVFWHYYQFKQICAAEGGGQVFQPMQRNVGWETSRPASLQGALVLTKNIPNIGFVRIKRGPYDPMPELGEGGLLDVKYVSGETYSANIGFKASDLGLPIVYKYSFDSSVDSDQRITRFFEEVRDAKTDALMVRNVQLEFHWRSIPIWHWFGPAGVTGCPLVHPETGNYQLIQTKAFKN